MYMLYGMWNVYSIWTIEENMAIKRNKLPIYATTWMNLKHITLRERGKI